MRTLIIILAAGLCLCAPGRSAAAADAIKSVSVSVRFTANPPPAPMVEKIRFSAEQVGIKALDGKSTDEAELFKTELLDLMGKIFNQVLGGYLVSDVRIVIKPDVSIDILLEPIPPFVESFDVTLEFAGGTHSRWNELMAAEREAIKLRYQPLFKDVPVLSERWSAKVIADTLLDRDELEAMFPGFRVEPTLDIGEHTVLHLGLTPEGETVRMVTVKIRSATIPSLTLERLKFEAATRADLIVGLPLEFAESRHNVIATEISSHLENTHLAQTLHLSITPRLMLTSRSRLNLLVESSRYSVFVRAKIDVGKDNKDTDLESHLGVFLIDNIEVFTEFNFDPGPISLESNIGVGWRVTPYLYAATGRNFTEGITRIWLDAYLSEDVILSWETGVSQNKDKDIEGSIKFKAHEFFSFDIVSDFNTDVWVRFNANL